jgi:hypothetical protein
MKAAAPAHADALPSQRMRLRHGVRVVLTVAVCAIAWTWLLRNTELATVRRAAAQLPAWAWILAAMALLGGHGLRALRLQSEWRHVRPVAWWQCLRLVLLHNAMVLALPLRTGEVGYLWLVRREWGVGWRAASVALLRWRVQDAAVLALLAIALLVPGSPVLRLLLAAGAAALLHLLLPPLWTWLRARAGAQDAGRTSPGLWRGMGVSAANWTLKLLANGGLLAALAGIAPAVSLRAALGGELAGVQPLQPPAGLGTYEAGVWLAAGLPQALAPAVVAAALAVHAFSLAVAFGAAAVVQLPAAQRRFTGERSP